MRARILTVLVFVVLAIALFVSLDRTPPPWWDEGWTLVVAKTWVERGMYARLLAGEFAGSGLSAQPPTTALVALAFRVWGIGLAQARFVIALTTLASLAVLYLLVSRLYDRGMALATLIVGSLMSMHPQANPITMGRQVLAEPLMLLLLVIGALFLYMGLEHSFWFIAPALVCWSIAIITKAQVLPFWAASLAVPLGFALLRRQRRPALIFGVALVGGYLVYQAMLLGLNRWLAAIALPESGVSGQIETVAFLPVLSNRMLALSNVLKFELPLLVGLAYFGWMVVREWKCQRWDESAAAVQLSLWSFGVSWLGWYLLFANAGIPRYLYPPAFVGSIFLAALLRDLTFGFDLMGTAKRAAFMFNRRGLTAAGLRALFAILLAAVAVPFTVLILGWFFLIDTNTSAQQMARYIDAHARPGALVESYDSELFFYLDHPYHYPPDQTHVDLIRRTLDQSVPIHYDALSANPDYLVIGPFSSGWRLYDEWVPGGSFRLIETEGAYRLYQRVR